MVHFYALQDPNPPTPHSPSPQTIRAATLLCCGANKNCSETSIFVGLLWLYYMVFKRILRVLRVCSAERGYSKLWSTAAYNFEGLRAI